MFKIRRRKKLLGALQAFLLIEQLKELEQYASPGSTREASPAPFREPSPAPFQEASPAPSRELSPAPVRERRQAAEDALERVQQIHEWEAAARAPDANESEDEAEAEKEEEMPDDFAVTSIIDERVVDGARELLILWEDGSTGWEPVANADNCSLILRQYNEEIDPIEDDLIDD